jgi:hypothetical protein
MLGMGNVIEGEITRMKDEGGMMKVKTSVGVFEVNCKHKHKNNEKVSLLIRQSPSPVFGRGARGEGDEIKLKVEDVLFKRDQFQVKLRGGLVIHLKEAPKVGQIIRVKVQVECLS